jgi:hypothetical protein
VLAWCREASDYGGGAEAEIDACAQRLTDQLIEWLAIREKVLGLKDARTR